MDREGEHLGVDVPYLCNRTVSLVVEGGLAPFQQRQAFGRGRRATRKIDQERVLGPLAAAVGDAHVNVLHERSAKTDGSEGEGRESMPKKYSIV